MSGSLNRAVIIGRLGADAELKQTPDGTPVANFRVATTDSWRSKDGQRHEQTEWHTIILWAKPASDLAPFLVKGKEVAIEGRIQTRMWEKDGQKHYKTEIKADRVVLLGKREDASPVHAAPKASAVDDDVAVPF